MVRVGTIIKGTLSAFGIKPTTGCRCYQLAIDMNSTTPDEIEKDIERWTDEMVESIKEWRKEKTKAIPQPPRLVVRRFILWACAESRKSSTTENDNEPQPTT